MFLCDPYVHLTENFQSTVPLLQSQSLASRFFDWTLPEVECISKGKARTPYEFGVKVSIATTLKEGLVVGMRSMPGNPYDGHTLAETIEQVGILADRAPTTVIDLR